MSEGAEGGDRSQRERPSHWLHPVDEGKRLQRARSHRRRRVTILVTLLVLAGLFAAYSYLTSDRRVQKFAESYLEDLLGTKVSIQRASFSWSEGLVLENLRVIPPAPFKEPILAAQRVDLKVKPLSLLLLAPEVTEIVVHRPGINLVLWDEQVWNFQALARARPSAAIGQRPIIAIEEGTLRIERKVAGETVYDHQMRISGLILPSETEPGTSRFQTDVKSQTVHLAVASGKIDGTTGSLSFEGEASNIALTQDLYNVLPHEAQRVWDRFEPTGSINLQILFDEKEGLRLVADLTGVYFSDTYKGQAYAFENLTGRCAFSPTGLVLSGVQGLVNKTPVRLDGTVTGFDAERLGLDVAVQADHVDFEQNRAGLTALAPSAAVLYEWYSPKGQVDVALKVHRDAGKDAPIEVTGTGYCRDIEETYAAFPYKLERLHGTVNFGSDSYQTSDMEGYHGQAVVRIEGWTKNPGMPLMESRVRVHGRNIPLDKDLRAALGPVEQKVFDQYTPPGGEAMGLADVEVEVYRAPQADATPQVTVQLNLLGCTFQYVNFPYRLTETTGRLNIFSDHTEIVGVRGHHESATVTFSGEVAWPDPQSDPEVNLTVTGEDVPLDEKLDAALPPREREVMKVYHLSGLADFSGTVVSGAKTRYELDYDLTINLKNARMVYEPFPFAAEQMSGRLRLAHGTCRIDSITGYNSGARIEATGWIDQQADDYAMDITLVGKDITLGESLRGALGPEMRAAWSHLAPKGRVDINAHLLKALGPQEPVKHKVLVTAKDAQARLDFFPYPLDHVTGELEFEGNRVLLRQLKAVGGSTEFGLDGSIVYGAQGPEVEMAIRTKGLRLEGPLRDAIPAPLRRTFDLIHPTGRVDMNLSQLIYRPTGPETSETRWKGSALLDEVGLDIGLKATGLVGTAQLQGRYADGKVVLQGDLRIQQGKVADKVISDARLVIEKTADSPNLAVRTIEGEFYGGRVEGSASIQLEPSVRYALTLAATDVDFERLVREGFRLSQDISGGRLKATLGLRASGPGASEVEASGYADVSDARLFQLPVIMRVFSALRLAPADPAAFEKARILYFVRGKRLILGDIRLEGRAVSLYGAGVVEPDGQLHMTFMAGKKNDDPLVPALYELGEGLRKELMIVMVTGTLAEPQVELRTLSGLTAPLREMVALVREQRAREDAARRR
jgi:hypothetical protein